MGRRKDEPSVTQRFVSFGSSLKGLGAPRRQGSGSGYAGINVEMVPMQAQQRRPVYIATSSLSEFPPLPAPGAPPPGIPKPSKGSSGALQSVGSGPPLPLNGVQQQQQQLRADSAPQVAVASGSSNGIKQPVRADSLVVLESSLAQKEEEVRTLRRQLDEALCNRQDAERRRAELEGHALLATQELATSISGRYEQQRAAAYQRMGQLHQAAMELLASFQQQGYEVAAGLDALQDDLDDTEAVIEQTTSRRATASSTTVSLGGDAGQAAAAVSQQDEGELPEVAAPTEKMVLLKARREHVETAFLDLVKASVQGLERLIELSSPRLLGASTPGSGGAGPSKSGSMGDLTAAGSVAAG